MKTIASTFLVVAALSCGGADAGALRGRKQLSGDTAAFGALTPILTGTASPLWWCQFQKQMHGITPNKSWGSLQDQTTKNMWESHGCNAKTAAAAPFWTKCYKDENAPGARFADTNNEIDGWLPVLGHYQIGGMNRDDLIRGECEAKGLKYKGQWHDCGTEGRWLQWNFKGYCEPPTADEAKTKIVEQWCKNTKAAHGIVPNNSWGSLQDKETRAYWKAFQCDTKAAAAPFWTKYYNDDDAPSGNRDERIRGECEAQGLTYKGKHQADPYNDKRTWKRGCCFDEDENPTPCPVVMGTPGTRDVVMYLPEKLCRLVRRAEDEHLMKYAGYCE